MDVMYRTFDVSKLLKFKVIKYVQSVNIHNILSTFEVLKLFKFRLDILHPLNICDIFVTLDVSKPFIICEGRSEGLSFF